MVDIGNADGAGNAVSQEIAALSEAELRNVAEGLTALLVLHAGVTTQLIKLADALPKTPRAEIVIPPAIALLRRLLYL